jgi:hypothetical protein
MNMWNKRIAIASFLLFGATSCGCTAGEDDPVNKPVLGSNETVVDDNDTSERPVRVIVTLHNIGDVDAARAALLRAGVTLADPIEGQPMIVVEALRTQLEAGLQGIGVKSIQRDSLSPSN